MPGLPPRVRVLLRNPLTWLVALAVMLSLYVAEPVIGGDLAAAPIVVLAAVSIAVAVIGVGWALVLVCTRFLPSPSAGIALLFLLLAFTHLLLPRIGAGVVWIAFHFVIIPIFCVVLGVRCLMLGFRQRSVNALLLGLALIPLTVLGITLYDPQWIVRFLNIRLDGGIEQVHLEPNREPQRSTPTP
jgi:hypothetical protein